MSKDRVVNKILKRRNLFSVLVLVSDEEDMGRIDIIDHALDRQRKG